MTDHPTPPALTAAQMADLELLLKYIGPVGDDNLTIDEDNDVVVPGWGCLDMDDLRLLLHAIAIARSGDPDMTDHTTTREYDQMRAQFDAIASRERAALTTATARLSEVTNEWESCLERDRAHRDEVREYQARLTEVERERDTARKDAEEWRTTELERTIAQARQDLANLDADLSAERWGREEDIKCAARALTTAQARIEALEAENAALRGIKPEFPPRPPIGLGMPRYGIRHNGPTEPLAVPMDDGYWTPWHLADAEITDWMLVADGVKHDWRCMHGEADTTPCQRCRLTAARTRAEGLEAAMAEARAALHTEGWMRHVPAIVCAVGCIDRALTPPPAPTGEEPTR